MKANTSLRSIGFTLALIAAFFMQIPACAHAIANDYDVKKFGAKGDGKADDTSSIQKALDSAFAGGAGHTVSLTAGNYKITKPLRVPRNVDIRGEGIGFASVLSPVNCRAIEIVGAHEPGGYSFRNRIDSITIVMKDAKSKEAIIISETYTVTLSEVFVYDARLAGIRIENSNHVRLDDISVYGTDTGIGEGIVITDSTVNAYNINVENFLNAITVRATSDYDGKLNLFGGHIERFGGYGILLEGSSYNLISGARILAPSSSSVPIAVKADKSGKLFPNHNTIIGSQLLVGNSRPNEKKASEFTPVAAYAGESNRLINTQVIGKPKAFGAAKNFDESP